MENEKIKKQGSYFTGILGAIIGGSIATIPWVLAYLYGNVMLSLLAVLIAAGELFGYKTFKGKMDKKVPIIIIILAILIVTIVTLLVIPAMLIAKENLTVNINSLKNVYAYNQFSSAIIRDYIISVIFTILGASVITGKIRKDILNNQENGEKLDEVELNKKIKQDAIDLIKPIFEKYNALDETNTLTKEEVFAEIENENKKVYFSELKGLGILKNSKGKYYYDVSSESNIKIKQSKGKIAIIAMCVIFAIVIASMVYAIMNTTQSTVKIWNDDVSYEISSRWQTLEEYTSQKGWSYYQYVSGLPTASENTEKTNTVDYTKYPATLNIAYDTETTEDSIKSVDELKETLETYITEQLMPEEYFVNVITTGKGYKAVEAQLHYTSAPEEIDCIYYIFNDGKIGYITASTFNMDDEDDLKLQIKNIVDTFDWTK